MKEEPTQMILQQVAHLVMQQSIYKLGEYDLKPWQAGILFAMNSHGGLSQRELAKIIRVTPPTMTVAIKKMERQGFLTRKPDENDQRIIRLHITEKGKDCISECKEVYEELESMLWQDISAEERLLLRRLLIQMRINITKNLKGSEMHMYHHHHHGMD